jgi:hypothetical protein
MDREIWVGATESGKKVVLEGANGAFGRVSTLDARWDTLEVSALFNEKFF